MNEYASLSQIFFWFFMGLFVFGLFIVIGQLCVFMWLLVKDTWDSIVKSTEERKETTYHREKLKKTLEELI